MQHGHIQEDVYRRFLTRQTSRIENSQIVRHLLAECPQCQELANRLTGEGGYWLPKPELAETDYGRVIRSSFESSDQRAANMAIAGLRGWGQWAALEPLSPEVRLDRVVGSKEYHHWGFYRALLDASRWFSMRAPGEAVEIMRLALTVIELLDEASLGSGAAAIDMRAKGHALLGNALRLASDLDTARAELDEAWRLNALGTGDPIEKAQLISYDASWSRTVGEFEVAEASLDEALRIYRAAGDRHMQGRMLLQMGSAIGYDDPERGLAHIRAGLQLVDTVREPRLELSAKHNMAHFLSDAGRPQEALEVLESAHTLYSQFRDDWVQLRWRWLKGKIARNLGQILEATSIFRQVWEAFRERDSRLDLVMVSIDLAEALAASGEYEGAAQLIAEVHPILTNWNLPRHALAAWLVFQQVVEGQRREEVFTNIRHFYRRHWFKPADFSA